MLPYSAHRTDIGVAKLLRNSHTTAQTRRLCVSRDEGYLLSQTEQTSVARNSQTAQALCEQRRRLLSLRQNSKLDQPRNRISAQPSARRFRTAGASGLRNAPVPGSVSPTCFMVRISFREAEAVQYAAERLKQSRGNRRGGRKKNAVTAVGSINRSTQAGRTRMRRNSKSNQPYNRFFR